MKKNQKMRLAGSLLKIAEAKFNEGSCIKISGGKGLFGRTIEVLDIVNVS